METDEERKARLGKMVATTQHRLALETKKEPFSWKIGMHKEKFAAKPKAASSLPVPLSAPKQKGANESKQ